MIQLNQYPRRAGDRIDRAQLRLEGSLAYDPVSAFLLLLDPKYWDTHPASVAAQTYLESIGVRDALESFELHRGVP